MEPVNGMPFSKPRPAPAQLINVVQYGTPDVLQSALKAWYWPVNEVDADELTLFFRAVYYGRFDNADRLLLAGADVDTPGLNGWTPLFWATYRQLASTVRFLLSRGADPDIRTADGGWPMFWAVCQGQDEIVSLLLAAGADLTLVDAAGRNVTWLAKSLGHEAIFNQLSSFRQSIEVCM